MRKRNKILFIVSIVFVLVSMFCVQSFAYLTVVPEADTQSSSFGLANIPITSFTSYVTNSDNTEYSLYNFEFHTSGAHGSDYGFEDALYTNQVNASGIGRVYGNYRVESVRRDRVNDYIPATVTVGTRLQTNNIMPHENFYFMIGSGVNIHSWSSDESLRRRTSLIIYSDREVTLQLDYWFDYMYREADGKLKPGKLEETLYVEPSQVGSSWQYDLTPSISSCLLEIPDNAVICGGFCGVSTVDQSDFDPQQIIVYNQIISSISMKRLYDISLNNGITQTFSLFTWLGDALSGVFNVPLFYIGTAQISLGIMFLAPFSILTMIMVLKMFAGG